MHMCARGWVPQPDCSIIVRRWCQQSAIRGEDHRNNKRIMTLQGSSIDGRRSRTSVCERSLPSWFDCPTNDDYFHSILSTARVAIPDSLCAFYIETSLDHDSQQVWLRDWDHSNALKGINRTFHIEQVPRKQNSDPKNTLKPWDTLAEKNDTNRYR